MSAETVFFTAVQIAAVALLGWSGWVLAGERIAEGTWEWPERVLLSLVSFVAFSCLLMIGHIVLGGALFGVAPVVPVLAAATVGAAVRKKSRRRESLPWIPIAGMVLALGLVYITPMLVGGSSVRTGDPSWHLGWTQQLLHGEAVPTGPAPEFGRNAYPWGFHAVGATMTRLVPGSDPVIAHEALHVILVLAIPLAAACLARRLDRRAGWAGAGAAAFVGGFGWIAATRPEFFTSPREARLGADLVVASPNSVYELLPPALPRELGLVVLAAAGVTLASAARRGSRRARRAAGAIAGIAGLVSLPMFVSALMWMLLGSLSARREERRAALLDTLVPAGVVFALWAGPVVANFVRHGGFVDVTPRLGVEWPLPVALFAWGLLLPAAAAGVVVVIRAVRVPGRGAVLSYVLGTLMLLGLALLRGRYDWGLAGNATLLHQGRVWPVAHLLGAAFAGVAVTRAALWVAARRERAGAALGAALLGIASASPVYASARLTEIITANRNGFAFSRDDFSRDAFARRAASRLTPDDVVEVEDSRLLAALMFSFSGARLAAYDDLRAERNDLRIRYADPARAWDEKMAAGGFEPTWRIVPLDDLPPGAEPAEKGVFGDRRWALIAADEDPTRRP